MYKSIVQWRDLEDGHLYSIGESYPHDGREVSEERLAELSGTQNKAGFALIKAVEEKVAQEPTETPKPQRTPRKTTKKP